MFKCSNCGAAYTVSDTICPQCGLPLFDPRSSTVALQVDPNLLRLRRNRSTTGPLQPERAISMLIRGMIERFIFEDGTEVILGRTDLLASTPGHFDLTRYGAHDRGVSRSHALLRFTDDSITITDLNSSNGTFINTQKLPAHKPYPLRDGDEIMLGSLSMVIRFE